jgi:hypothetical protein
MADLEVDYLVIGAGAAGMAFTDSLISDSDATIAIVDRRHRPGGHWNDAYPFVRLHQPSAFYGVNSLPLGSGAVDAVGLNRGLAELASGHEVLSHFDQAMQQRFLPTGRVEFLAMTEYAEGVATSLLSGERRTVSSRVTVDASYSAVQVPSRRPPSYAVDAGVACVPLNDLPDAAPSHESFTVVGAGKTGMDACIWLLLNGAPPERIRWVVPRDAWLLDRACFQFGDAFARTAQSLADQVEAITAAKDRDDVFLQLEARGELVRLDSDVMPTAYHCAIVSQGELAQLRRIEDVVRMGRVTRLTPTEMQLESGTVPNPPGTLFVDCSAAGIPGRPARPVFSGDRITLQWVRLCQPTFSAALIGHVEAMDDDEQRKNWICQPIAPPTVPSDWLRMMAVELDNRQRWSADAELQRWQSAARLDPFTSRLGALGAHETDAMAHLGRYLEHVGPATERIPDLLAQP